MNRVVITGMGIYSCIGKNLDEVRDALFAGKSGIVYDASRKEAGFRSALTGMVEPPVLKGKLDRRMRASMAEEAEYAYLSAIEALQHARLDEGYMADNEVGILYGNDSSAKAVIESVDISRLKKDNTLIGSGAIFQSMNSTVTMNLATIFKIKGINLTISAACASSSHAIGLGYFLIRGGMQDTIICGGAQEINEFVMGSFDGIGAFSVREDKPTEASRPFDKDRDGLVPSGGAATVIIESLESAQRRGAPIIAEIIGYGFSSNGAHIIQPNVEGPTRSLKKAIRDAGIKVEAIDYINAHATSTALGDSCEAQAMHEVFGNHKPPISSTKSMTGHECWMAGASELVYSTLMMQHSFVAPNINFETPDEDSAKLHIAAKTIEKRIDTFLTNSFGFGGTNSTLIVTKFLN